MHIPHLLPTSTGHPTCFVRTSPSPEACRFNQKTADPLSGNRTFLISGKAVAPPSSTFVICI